MPMKQEFVAEFESKGARKLIDDIKAMQSSFDDLGQGMEALSAGKEVFSFVGQEDMPALEAMQEKIREAHKSMMAIRAHIKKEGLGAEEVRALGEASDQLSTRLQEMMNAFAESKFADSKEWQAISTEIYRMQDGIEGIGAAKTELDKVQQGMESLLGSGDQIKSAFRGIGKESPLRTFIGSRKAIKGFGKQAMTVGKTMSKMKGLAGVAGKGLMKVGAAALGGAGAFVAVGAAAAGAVYFLFKITDAMAKFSRKLVEAHGAFEMAELSGVAMSEALTVGDFRAGLRMSREAIRDFADTTMDATMSAAEAEKGFMAFSKAGLRVGELGQTKEELKDAMQAAATAGIRMGGGFERGSELIARFMVDTGNTVEGLRESFARVSRSAAVSGMSTASFTATLMQMEGPLGVLDSRFESAGKQLAFFTDSLGAAMGKDVVAKIREAFTGSLVDLQKHVSMIGRGLGGAARIQEILESTILQQASRVGQMLSDTRKDLSTLPKSVRDLGEAVRKGTVGPEAMKDLADAISPEDWKAIGEDVSPEARLLGFRLARLKTTAAKSEKSMGEVSSVLYEMVEPTVLFTKRMESTGKSLEYFTNLVGAAEERTAAKLMGLDVETFRNSMLVFLSKGKKTYDSLDEVLQTQVGFQKDLAASNKKATLLIYEEMTGSATEAWNTMTTKWGKMTEDMGQFFENVWNEVLGTTDKEIRKASDRIGKAAEKGSSGGQGGDRNVTSLVFNIAGSSVPGIQALQVIRRVFGQIQQARIHSPDG